MVFNFERSWLWLCMYAYNKTNVASRQHIPTVENGKPWIDAFWMSVVKVKMPPNVRKWIEQEPRLLTFVAEQVKYRRLLCCQICAPRPGKYYWKRSVRRVLVFSYSSREKCEDICIEDKVPLTYCCFSFLTRLALNYQEEIAWEQSSPRHLSQPKVTMT